MKSNTVQAPPEAPAAAPPKPPRADPHAKVRRQRTPRDPAAMSAFAKHIAEERVKRGWSVNEMAARAGFVITDVSRLELGGRMPTVIHVEGYSTALSEDDVAIDARGRMADGVPPRTAEATENYRETRFLHHCATLTRLGAQARLAKAATRKHSEED